MHFRDCFFFPRLDANGLSEAGELAWFLTVSRREALPLVVRYAESRYSLQRIVVPYADLRLFLVDYGLRLPIQFIVQCNSVVYRLSVETWLWCLRSPLVLEATIGRNDPSIWITAEEGTVHVVVGI